MQKISFGHNQSKQAVVEITINYINALRLSIIGQDISKPWGAYFVIDEKDIDLFIQEYFDGIHIEKSGKLTPKFLLVAPDGILSWQYHHRRAELWKVVSGPVDIIQSGTNKETTRISKNSGELITHGVIIRHRLIGTGVWSLVAEIWQHTNPQDPSNEEDIVRILDVYGR